ncbi:acyltransferase [Gemella sp. 19428wG2_WT2a]|nr:acyltransferase [Gemella sp. 19428wG2_WT2a]TFU59147.1 acyltransferase [Gemella sp. WT2a]
MEKKKRYLPSIDSIRAIAVISVIIYHINPKYLPGGFLGVDLFFVLSGYLISSLIMREYRITGKLNLWNFYIRRARRLLPAVYLMISIVLIVMVLFNKSLLEKTYLDALFGYVYSSNWWYIFHKLDYFDTFSTSPFKHLWSLAIEEQFYLLFPLIFLMFNNKSRKVRLTPVYKFLIFTLIFASLATHIYLFDPRDMNRVYYGTDTRAFGLLVGVAGAFLFPMYKLTARINKKESIFFTFLSVISIAVFIWSMFFVSESDEWMYRGGFLVYSILFLIIIISTGRQRTFISRLMSFTPLVYIGKISYSLYLWHFPIIVLSSTGQESSWISNIFRLVLIFFIAFVSYTIFETPIRKYGVIKYFKVLIRLMFSLRGYKKILAVSMSIATIILLLMGSLGKAMPITSTFFNKEDTFKLDSVFQTGANVEVPQTTKQEESSIKVKKYTNLLVLGDSLAVNIGERFVEKYAGAVVDGKVSRQGYQMVELLPKYASYNIPTTAVIYMIGTNGNITKNEIDEMVKAFDKTEVYFVNVNVPRAWQDANNKLLEDAKSRYSNVNIIDWYTLGKKHREYFEADYVHLNSSGIQAMINLISSAFKYEVESPQMMEKKKAEEEAKRKAEEEAKKKELAAQTSVVAEVNQRELTVTSSIQ